MRKLSAQSIQIRMDQALNAFLEGKIDRADLKEMANASGKIQAPSMGQLKYYVERGEKPDLEFFKEDKALARSYKTKIVDIDLVEVRKRKSQEQRQANSRIKNKRKS